MVLTSDILVPLLANFVNAPVAALVPTPRVPTVAPNQQERDSASHKPIVYKT